MLSALITPTLSHAQMVNTTRPDFTSLGLFTNDTLWDGQDRWHTGSYQRSFFFDQGQFEMRMRHEYLAPVMLTHPNQKTDRPYASIAHLSFQRYQYFDANAIAFGIGVDWVNEWRSPERLHHWLHKKGGYNMIALDGYRTPPETMMSVYASWRADHETEIGYLVPFLEAEFGMRQRATAGFDAILTKRHFLFFTREQTTGHLLGFPIDADRYSNFSWDVALGGDVSFVNYDYSLDNPISNVTRRLIQYRARLGIRFHMNNATLLFGPTYISPEFEEQAEGQVLQVLSIELRF